MLLSQHISVFSVIFQFFQSPLLSLVFLNSLVLGLTSVWPPSDFLVLCCDLLFWMNIIFALTLDGYISFLFSAQLGMTQAFCFYMFGVTQWFFSWSHLKLIFQSELFTGFPVFQPLLQFLFAASLSFSATGVIGREVVLYVTCVIGGVSISIWCVTPAVYALLTSYVFP